AVDGAAVAGIDAERGDVLPGVAAVARQLDDAAVPVGAVGELEVVPVIEGDGEGAVAEDERGRGQPGVALMRGVGAAPEVTVVVPLTRPHPGLGAGFDPDGGGDLDVVEGRGAGLDVAVEHGGHA